jgi:hypothetical protein
VEPGIIIIPKALRARFYTMKIIPSLKRSPSACVLFALSDPAKSTRWNLHLIKSFLEKEE